MKVTFEEDYLRELYEDGKAKDKKHRFQEQIVRKYIRIVDLMIELTNVMELTRYGGLHYEHLRGDKEGISSVRVNDKYRIEFREIIEEGKTIAEIVNITELSNHYKR
jgi:proteic killer suppression protein